MESSTDLRAKQRREHRSSFVCFLVGAALEIGMVLFGDLTFRSWQDWIIAGGAFFFPIMAALSLVALRKNWTLDQSEAAVKRTFGWIIGIPVIFAALLAVGWSLFSFFGWLGTIPAWAAVIIVLLILILLK